MTRQGMIDVLVRWELDYLLARYGDAEHVEDMYDEVVEEYEGKANEDLQQLVRARSLG